MIFHFLITSHVLFIFLFGMHIFLPIHTALCMGLRAGSQLWHASTCCALNTHANMFV